MYCKNCGEPIGEGQAVCLNCGYEAGYYSVKKSSWFSQNKPLLTLICILLEVLTIIFMLIPANFYIKYFDEVGSVGVSFWDMVLLAEKETVAVTVLGLMGVIVLLVTLFALTVYYHKKQSGLCVGIATIFSFLTSVLLLVLLFIVNFSIAEDGELIKGPYASFLYYLVLLFQISVSVITMIVLLTKRDSATQRMVRPALVDNNAHIRELKKYKELLDSGIITKEEFDEIKAGILKKQVPASKSGAEIW